MVPEEILESISDAFYAVDEDWCFTYVNYAAERWWGRDRGELIGRHCWSEFPQALGSDVYKAHIKAALERRVVRVEALSPTLGHWLEISIFPTTYGLSVYFRDISERKSAESRQQLLLNELNHRVKNTLATVQAIAAQTFRGAHTSPMARSQFTDRLVALAGANDLLVAKAWRGADIRDLVSQVAAPHRGDEAEPRFALAGPELLLTPKATTSLALALHELATNACKYGALSGPSGQVSITWSTVGVASSARFLLNWIETGGPRVAPPTHRGFGSVLLERSVALDLLADVHLDFRESGLHCVIDAPTDQVVALGL